MDLITERESSKMAGARSALFTTLLLFISLLFRRKRNRFLRNLRLLSLQRRKRVLLACHHALEQQNRRNNRRWRQKTAWVYERPQFWFEQLLNNRAEDHLWRENFRVNRNTFQYICGLVRQNITKQDTILRNAIPVEKRVAIALWRLSTGNSYRTVALTFGVGRCTAMNIKDEFCEVLISQAHRFIRFPRTQAETRKCIQDFENISTFPQVVGALDGSHIPISAPTENANDYRNRKKFTSVILQGVADANGRFIHVSTGYPGSIHDARVLRMSSLYTAVENNRILNSPLCRIGGRMINPLLVVDPAYKLTSWCMKPYPQARGITPRQEAFNKSLSSARVVIEQAFGLLKGRWRCLLDKLDESVDKVSTTIITCCILHNICLDQNDDTEIEPVRDGNGNNPVPVQVHNPDGTRLRNHILNTLF